VSLSVPMHPGRTRWDRDRRRFRTPPVFLGYVGFGLADGVAVGNVFASPSAEQILDATREVHGDAGVLYLYGNYSGDVMNFDFAAELAGAEGIEIATVLGADDVASAPRGSSRAGGESPASPCCTRWRALGQKRVLRSPRCGQYQRRLCRAAFHGRGSLVVCVACSWSSHIRTAGRGDGDGMGSTASPACEEESSNPLRRSPNSSSPT